MNNKYIIIFSIVFGVWFCSKPDKKPPQNTAYTTPISSTISSPSYVAQQEQSVPESNIQIKYVNTDKLNVRSKPDGKIITTLKRGQKVTVYEKNASWIRITPDGEPTNWVSSKLLCDTTECNDENWLPQVTPKQSKPKPEPKSHSNYNSGCSCSSGRVCFGPRGGRYCITSGGNKRYGV